MTVSLEWSMSREGDRLRVRHRLHNRSGVVVHVCEGLIVESEAGGYEPSDRLVVQNGGAPGEVIMTLGQTAADMPVFWLLPARFRALQPGATHEGESVLPWPLEAWHTNGQVFPLLQPVRTAQLVVHTFSGAPDWKELPARGGGSIRVADAVEVRPVTGEGLPIQR